MSNWRLWAAWFKSFVGVSTDGVVVLWKAGSGGHCWVKRVSVAGCDNGVSIGVCRFPNGGAPKLKGWLKNVEDPSVGVVPGWLDGGDGVCWVSIVKISLSA